MELKMKLAIEISIILLLAISIDAYAQEKPIQFGEEIEMDHLVAGKNKGKNN